MSTSVVRGSIQNFSPKPSEDYYGVLIKEERGENWYNGQGTIPDNLSKGQKVKLKVNKDRFCEIDEINIMEPGSSEGGKNIRGDDKSVERGENPGSAYIPPELQVALKEAAETARHWNHDKRVEHVDAVEELTQEYYRILKQVGGEK